MNMFELAGFNAYFAKVKYHQNPNREWLNGWMRAERESRCGWYDKQGAPSAWNKAK